MILALAIIYVIAGKSGLSLAIVNPSATAVWPPTGIALAALLLFGYEVWPGIFLGALVVNMMTAGTVATSFGIAVGNTLEAITGYYLVSRFANGQKTFTRAQDIFRFAFFAGLVATVISATFGVTALCLGKLALWPEYWKIWLTWWLGDGTGALVVTPLLVLWYTNPRLQWRRTQIVEAIVLAASLGFVCQTVFGGLFPASHQNYPLEFLAIPLLIWAAFRFGLNETATATFVLAAIAIWGTHNGYGPFVRSSLNESLLLFQVFMCVIATMCLSTAALVVEQKETEAKLQHLATVDSLTGLANYRRFMEALTEELSRSERTRRPFAIVLLDMDGLKKINDKHGHLVGSRALVRLADVLKKECRNIDTAARFGGDEFCMVLVETEKSFAQQVASRVMERLAAEQEKPPLSVSVGVSEFPGDGETTGSLLDAADRALYRMKRSEEKRIILAR